MKKITFYHKGKQLVLKNPSNTGRIKTLLELFPNAKFIHIHRNPYEVYVSCVDMFKKLMPLCQLQSIDWEEMDNYILYIYKEMMQKYFEEKKLIPVHNLVEISFKQLKASPLEVIESIYTALDLNEFQNSKLKINEYIKTQESYKQNQFTIDSDIYSRVNKYWDFTFNELGYEMVKS